MTMKVGSALAAFTLFGKSIAISLSSDESVESHISVDMTEEPHDDCCFLYDENYYWNNKAEICVDKSDAGHGPGSEHLWGFAGASTMSWRCGKNTHIIFCDGAGPRWVDGQGYVCDG